MLERLKKSTGTAFIIAGLGNPGKEYEHTRHNLGFMAVDILAEDLGIRVVRAKHRALTGSGVIGGRKVMLVKPQTYMNESGVSLREILRYHRADPSSLIVIYDDADLPAGSLRIRGKGSAGTHNGMRSVVSCIGSEDFPRIRIGIGGGCGNMIDHVLGRMEGSEKEKIDRAVREAAEAAKAIVSEGVDAAMNRYNTGRGR